MNKQFKVRRIGNHWYPSINHELGYLCGFNEKIDRYLDIIDQSKCGELTIEFEELGMLVFGINIVYFDDQDIVRYLTTDDSFDLRFMVNDRLFQISSDMYWLLESVFNFNFHKCLYKIHIY